MVTCSPLGEEILSVRMRQPPKWTQFYRFPVVTTVSLLSIGFTIAWWCKIDVGLMFETAMIRRGEIWRLFTSILLHASLLHLVFNIYWFWIFGTIVEEVFGHLKTVVLISVLAVGSGSLEFAFASGGVGLSGVGYGFLGMLWVLSSRDERFRDSVDVKTVQLFVGWFFFCVFTTLMKWFPVANVAHGAGAVLGISIGFAISSPRVRTSASAAVVSILVLGLWGSTLGRPRINRSAYGGYEEGKWGYDALVAGRNEEAIRWFRDALTYKPRLAAYWFDLGIAYQKMGKAREAHEAYQRAQQLEPAKAEYADAATHTQ